MNTTESAFRKFASLIPEGIEARLKALKGRITKVLGMNSERSTCGICHNPIEICDIEAEYDPDLKSEVHSDCEYREMKRLIENLSGNTLRNENVHPSEVLKE